MKSVAVDRQLTSIGVSTKSTFGIDSASTAHIMTILRDKLYTDKVLAVIREYSANAWDAHREAGISDKPISVRLPTDLDPTLTIRDWGHGLSREEVLYHFTQYGSSSKRDSNRAVGSWGIGCKSGFAYTDQFTVTSWHNGTKEIYTAVLDDSNIGEMQLLHSVPCGDETGIEVKIPVVPRDRNEFVQKAQQLFPYFEPQPSTNIDIPSHPKTFVQEHGYFSKDSSLEWIAVMGCIPYRLDLSQFQTALTEEGLWDAMSKLVGGLTFEIGEVEISPSREELQYSKRTKDAVLNKIRLLLTEYRDKVLRELERPGLSEWDKFLKANEVSWGWDLDLIPKELEKYAVRSIRLYDKNNDQLPDPPAEFLIGVGTARPSLTDYVLPIRHQTKIFIWDNTNRSLAGYKDLVEGQPVVHVRASSTPQQVEKVLPEYLEKAGITGVSIMLLSHSTWFPSRKARYNGGVSTAKHRKRIFRLTTRDIKTSKPYSANWEVIDHEPSKDDVYIILRHFEGCGQGNNFYRRLKNDRKLARFLKVDLPHLYGYKTTWKQPVKYGDPEGLPYGEWRQKFFRSLITPEHKELVRHWRWSQLPIETWRGNIVAKEVKNRMSCHHPIYKAIYRREKGIEAVNAADPELRQLLPILANLLKSKRTTDINGHIDAILSKYPLIGYRGLGIFASNPPEVDHWVQYINLIDAEAERKGS